MLFTTLYQLQLTTHHLQPTFRMYMQRVSNLHAVLRSFNRKKTWWENKCRILWKLIPFFGISFHFIAMGWICKLFSARVYRFVVVKNGSFFHTNMKKISHRITTENTEDHGVKYRPWKGGNFTHIHRRRYVRKGLAMFFCFPLSLAKKLLDVNKGGKQKSATFRGLNLLLWTRYPYNLHLRFV